MPPIATSSTSRVSPGSKRTAVPAAMLSRMPYAAARSNASQRLTSKKWQCDPTCTGRSPRLLTSMRRVGPSGVQLDGIGCEKVFARDACVIGSAVNRTSLVPSGNVPSI